MNTSDHEESGVTQLLQQERFDHAALHRRPGNILSAEADNQMDRILRKECAGLRHDLRVGGACFRQAFISGNFGRKEKIVLRWTISGMREELFRTWHGLCALTIYELARGLRLLGSAAGGYAGYLNQWAEDPQHPLPSVAGWMLFIDDYDNLPSAAIALREGDPRRQDVPQLAYSYLDVDGLRYCLPTADLRRIQTTRGGDRGDLPT